MAYVSFSNENTTRDPALIPPSNSPRSLTLPGGKFYMVVAYAYDAGLDENGEIVATRYNADGTIDTAFGSDGRVNLVFEGPAGFNNNAVFLIQAETTDDGDLVFIAGYPDPTDGSGAHRKFYVNRILADGSAGTPRAVNSSYALNQYRHVYASLATYSDGSIVVAEHLIADIGQFPDAHDGKFAIKLTKFAADNTIDTSWATSGIAMKEFTTFSPTELLTYYVPPNVHARSNDAILFGFGFQSGTPGENPGVWAIRVEGDDGSFGSSHWISTGADSMSSTGWVRPHQIRESNNGFVIATMGTDTDDSSSHVQIVRFNTDLTPDTGFGTAGYADLTNIPQSGDDPFTAWIGEYAVDSAGRTYVLDGLGNGLGTYNHPTAWRYTATGAIDTSFGTSGVYEESTITIGAFNSILPDHNSQPGLTGWATNTDNTANFSVGSIFAADSEPTINRTVNKLIAVSGTKTYIGNNPSTMVAVANTGSFPIDASSVYVNAATLFGFTYIVDGANIRKLNLGSELFVAYAATAGTAPVGTTLAVAWRGRLILSGTDTDPQNVFASRVGNATDWDYGQTDASAAWSGNAAPSGRVGEPVVALAPISEDLMLIFSDNTIYAVSGDPADGGAINLVTDKVGIVGPNAWTRDATGMLYFVGANGLYKANADGTGATEISRDVFRQFFRGTNRSTRHTTLVYDPERYGIWIFVTPETQGSAETSLFYDIRAEGYWPIRPTNSVESGPLSAIYWDGFDDNSRYPLLGGYSGQLDSMNFTNRNDNGGAIDAFVHFTPFSLSEVDDATVTRIDITAGEVKPGDSLSVWNMNANVYGGKTAFDVTEGIADTPYRANYNFGAGGRQNTRVVRVRGGWFSLVLTNSVDNNYFSFEQATATVIPAGNQR